MLGPALSSPPPIYVLFFLVLTADHDTALDISVVKLSVYQNSKSFRFRVLLFGSPLSPSLVSQQSESYCGLQHVSGCALALVITRELDLLLQWLGVLADIAMTTPIDRSTAQLSLKIVHLCSFGLILCVRETYDHDISTVSKLTIINASFDEDASS